MKRILNYVRVQNLATQFGPEQTKSVDKLDSSYWKCFCSNMCTHRIVGLHNYENMVAFSPGKNVAC